MWGVGGGTSPWCANSPEERSDVPLTGSEVIEKGRCRAIGATYHVYILESRNPKGPCTYIVHIRVLKLPYGSPFKPQVYTIWVHGPLGKDHLPQAISGLPRHSGGTRVSRALRDLVQATCVFANLRCHRQLLQVPRSRSGDRCADLCSVFCLHKTRARTKENSASRDGSLYSSFGKEASRRSAVPSVSGKSSRRKR